MNDAEVIDGVLAVLQSGADWTAENLAARLGGAGWRPHLPEGASSPTGWDIGEVRSAVEGDDEDGLRWVVSFEEWDPDDYPDLCNDELEALAKPRADALRDLFAQRADATWQPGEIPVPDDGCPLGCHHGWHNDALSVEIGALQYDGGLPVMTVLRAYANPKS